MNTQYNSDYSIGFFKASFSKTIFSGRFLEAQSGEEALDYTSSLIAAHLCAPFMFINHAIIDTYIHSKSYLDSQFKNHPSIIYPIDTFKERLSEVLREHGATDDMYRGPLYSSVKLTRKNQWKILSEKMSILALNTASIHYIRIPFERSLELIESLEEPEDKRFKEISEILDEFKLEGIQTKVWRSTSKLLVTPDELLANHMRALAMIVYHAESKALQFGFNAGMRVLKMHKRLMRLSEEI